MDLLLQQIQRHVSQNIQNRCQSAFVKRPSSFWPFAANQSIIPDLKKHQINPKIKTYNTEDIHNKKESTPAEQSKKLIKSQRCKHKNLQSFSINYAKHKNAEKKAENFFKSSSLHFAILKID